MDKLNDVLEQASMNYDPSKPKGEKTEKPVEAYGMEKLAELQVGLTRQVEKSGLALTSGSWLAACVELKRLEDVAEKIRTEGILKRANVEYRGLQAVNPGAKQLLVAGAILQAYTYKKAWNYPQHVKVLEEALKTAKKEAEADGSAKAVQRGSNPDTDTVFTIKLEG
jgi:hypothetical protein